MTLPTIYALTPYRTRSANMRFNPGPSKAHHITDELGDLAIAYYVCNYRSGARKWSRENHPTNECRSQKRKSIPNPESEKQTMPINFFDSPEGRRVGQTFDSPTVYLDHWAIRLFSDDRRMQDRFVAALKGKRGTLLLSHISTAELGGASDPQHVVDAERFLERCLPQMFFTDFRLDEVLTREKSELSNATRFWPTADLRQLKLFGELSQDTANGFTLQGFAELAYENRTGINDMMRSMAQSFTDAVAKARADPNYVRKSRNAPLDDSRPRTLLILGELLRGFILDSGAQMSENDAVDLLHAAMPLNCCDYVLLDGPWAERVGKMKFRLAKSSMVMPLARCFSPRNAGVNAFLADLENFDPQMQPPPPRR